MAFVHVFNSNVFARLAGRYNARPGTYTGIGKNDTNLARFSSLDDRE